MRNALTISGAALAIAVLINPSFAADKYRIDPEHILVNFSIQHSMWAKYQGTIRRVDGEILFDKENVERSAVTVEILAKMVDTLDTSRDAELQGGYGFLNASAFPKITFKSTGIERTGDKTGRIRGNLTMAGTTKPVTLDAIFDGEGVSDWDGQMRVGFSANRSTQHQRIRIDRAAYAQHRTRAGFHDRGRSDRYRPRCRPGDSASRRPDHCASTPRMIA